tara:strand:- start:162 stop:1157 length:996 start_codon:yes stop_codon:yes gene_type:complete
VSSEELNPGRLLQLSGSYWQSCTLHAAVKLDLFTKIGKDSLKSNDLAERLKADKKAAETLLNALVSMGLLVKSNEIYTNTVYSQSFLCKDSEKYIGHIIMHHHYLVNSWSQLDKAVITGKPVKVVSPENKQEELESFLMGMFNMAMNLAPGLVEKIDISNRKTLLDLGGGPGTYAIFFCLNNPQLKATVADFSTTKPFAESVIKKFNLSDRIDFKGIDYSVEDIPGSYDVVWLSHIIHQENPQSAQKLINKAVAVLNPGGMIIIHDFILNNTMDGPLFPAIFSLNMLLATKSGQSYSQEQIENMFRSASIKDIKRIPFDSSNDSGIILGVI